MKTRLSDLFNRLWSSEFVRNATKLISGTAAAQAISLLTAPILYRIYEKEDYGTLGVYMAVAGVLGTFSTLQYGQAILLEKEDSNALQIMWLIRIANIILAILTLIGVLLLGTSLGHWLNNPAITPWLLLLPISIFFAGQNEIFRFWANRKKEYSLMTWNSILTAILVPTCSISLGLLYHHVGGLFAGLLVSQIIPAVYLGSQLSKRQSFGFSTLDFSTVKVLAKKHVDFPRFSLPAEFINRFSNQIPVFMLSTYAGPAVVGVYNLSVRMLGLPVTLISSAVSEVFRQKATEDYLKTGSCRKVYKKTLTSLSGIAIIPFLIVAFFAPDIFAFVFGEKWRLSGQFAQVLTAVYFLRFIQSPLSFLIFIFQKQQIDLIASAWYTLSSIIILYAAFNNHISPIIAIGYYAINFLIIYLIMFLYTYKLSKGNHVLHK
jgi:O-antigen/teichoic acid export membrane protein